MAYNLLTEKVVPIEAKEGTLWVTLPGAFAMMSSGAADGFAMVRPHQRHGLHMFAVQVAAMASEELSPSEIFSDNEDVWKQRLLKLAPEGWELVQDDCGKPGFLQPPMDAVSFKKAIEKKGNHVLTADDMTVLVRSRNHVVKFSRMTESLPWHWVCSLVEIQTLSGFEGRGLYGTARMYGGFGSRFMVGTYDDLCPSAMWKRDVRRALALLKGVERDYPFYGEAGTKHGLLWILPWDGESRLELGQLHPLFIDVSRRIRLFSTSDGNIASTYIISSCPRINSGEQNGRLGDPWAPINVKNNSSLGAKTIDVKLLRNLIIADGQGDYQQAPLQTIDSKDNGDLYFHLAAVIGGQGKTEGFHEKTIHIPGAIRDMAFGGGLGSKRLGDCANAMLNDADKAWSCLRKAVFAATQASRDEIDWKHPQSEAAAGKARGLFKEEYEDNYFPYLWSAMSDEGGDDWISFLRAACDRVLESILVGYGPKTQFVYKARAKATGMLSGSWNKEFKTEERNERHN